ncbi:hypothetical protein BDZ94DRAFT_69221 [Collybia nuda]|uniref:ATP-dependent DNA helicase n=1 Tax=Collybia nuda TaxID=64659 RepID=A0A9P5XZW5_9AGAR|nr:hypothetical protein BDZ94DRAFT_69221 [Collybia nuda]
MCFLLDQLSVLLREIIGALDLPTVGITASTGIAAVNIGGTTLHSWAGIGLGQEEAKHLAGKFLGQPKFELVLGRWRRISSLIIDEISMIDGALFDKLKDQAFVDMLNAMRFGKMDPKIINSFNGLARAITYTDGIEPTELYSTRREECPGFNSYGERVTQPQMEKLLERLVAPRSIELKVGAQVMLVKNLMPGVLVNGSVGKVVRFSTPAEAIKEHTEIAKLQKSKEGHVTDFGATGPLWPVIRFINGREIISSAHRDRHSNE